MYSVLEIAYLLIFYVLITLTSEIKSFGCQKIKNTKSHPLELDHVMKAKLMD